MPAEHIKQWHHNRAFIGRIDPDFPDWAVTATFYTALHAIDALLKHDKVMRVVSHASRNETLAKTNKYAKIWELYCPLYDMSRTIRYLAKPARWVSWPNIEGEVFRRYLYPLEASVLKLMGNADPLPPIKMKAATTAPEVS
jgi:hypothetical protein